MFVRKVDDEVAGETTLIHAIQHILLEGREGACAFDLCLDPVVGSGEAAG